MTIGEIWPVRTARQFSLICKRHVKLYKKIYNYQFFRDLNKDRLEQFKEIKSIDKNKKQEIMDIIEGHIITAKWFYRVQYYIFIIIAMSVIIVFALTLSVLSAAINYLYKIEPGFVSYYQASKYIMIILSYVPSFIFYTICLLLFYIFITYISYLLYISIMTKYSISRVINVLIYLIYITESNHDNWTNIRYKQCQLKMLERTAWLIEFYWLRLYACGDGITDKWFKETMMKQVAAAIREKKKWVLTPKKDTYEYFLKSITSTFICIVEGHWDEIERAEADNLVQLPWYRSFTPFLKKVLRTLLMVAIPVPLFFLFQLTPLAPAGVPPASLISLLSMYEAVVILSAINPNLGAIVSNIKDMKSLL